MRAATAGTLRVPGATLYYQVRGSGPVLLVLQGDAGAADGAAGLVDQLAAHYTVVTYDRRGLSRSTLDDPVEGTRLETHADDAHRLLAVLTTEPALVFGGGLGALIGLELVARHPERVRALVAHEPPAPSLLPGADRAEAERAEADRADLGAARADAPDPPALRAAAARIVPAAGTTSRERWTHRCAAALADLLGTAVVEFPGGHDGYVTHPRAFAARLREVLDGAPAGAPAGGRLDGMAGVPASRRTVDFDAAYAGVAPPWDIGRPQPAFLRLMEAGAIRGRVLDVGCGTGEHALLAAANGLDATGVDLSATAIGMAERKAAERGLTARFLVWDALDLAALGERFDTVLDCGLFHILDDGERERFVDALRAVTRPGARYHLLCFSDRQPGSSGPRRVTRDEIRACFAEGWRVDSIVPVTIDITIAAGGVLAWLAAITRT